MKTRGQGPFNNYKIEEPQNINIQSSYSPIKSNKGKNLAKSMIGSLLQNAIGQRSASPSPDRNGFKS